MQKPKEEDQQLISMAAALYYLDGISQDEIARRIYTSRSTVSRMLKRARDEKIVEIRIRFGTKRNTYYEEKLRETFGIEAIVLNNEAGVQGGELQRRGRELADSRVREALADWMRSHIHSGNTVGVTRGAIFYDIPEYLPEPGARGVSFVQLMGLESGAAGTHFARDVVTRLAERYRGRAWYLDAPLVFPNRAAREELYQVSTVAQTLAAARRADWLMTTVPRLAPGMKTHIWQGFAGPEEVEHLLSLGAVGAMFGRAFNLRGRFLDTALNRSIVSADPEALRSRPVLAVGYGKEYAAAVLGALRSGYPNTLITDQSCSEELFWLAEAGSGQENGG